MPNAIIPQTLAVLTTSPAVWPIVKARRPGWKCVGMVLAAAMFSPAILALPPVWHGAVRTALAWQASRSGHELTIKEVHGTVFGVTRLEGVQIRAVTSNTDLHVDHASFRVSAKAPWLADMKLVGARGSLDLAAGATGDTQSHRHFSGLGTRWQPANFSVQADDLRLQHGRDAVQLLGLLVTGKHGAAGTFAVREVHVATPGFTRTLSGGRGRTFWKDGCLTFSSVSTHDDATVANGTLDLTRFGRGFVKWVCSLRLLGGEVRGQGALDFSRADAPLDVAATMRHTALAPFARLLGLRGQVDGEVEQASFAFRGDPANLPAAQISLSGRATGFRWEDRRWQRLEVQAVVVNRRVQLNRFDLRQDGNRLTLSGEYPLPPGDGTPLRWVGEGSWWQAVGFTGNIDARLEDLGSLARLIGPSMPALQGRVSVNGRLGAATGSADVEGYLNVEGTGLSVRGAPLDYLHSTLLFRRGALEIADVQATQGEDYFAAHGTFSFSGDHAARTGELRAEVRDASVYLPALAAWPEIAGRIAPVRSLQAVVRMEQGELVFDRWEGEATELLLAQ